MMKIKAGNDSYYCWQFPIRDKENKVVYHALMCRECKTTGWVWDHEKNALIQCPKCQGGWIVKQQPIKPDYQGADDPLDDAKRFDFYHLRYATPYRHLG